MRVKRTVKKTVKRKSRKLSGKKFQRGTVGNFFVFGVLALLMVLGITAVGGLPSQMAPTSGQIVNVLTPTPGQTYSNLQLKTFGYVTIAPTATPPAKDSLCKPGGVNEEPWILVAYSPGIGQSVGTTGQVKVWVQDEAPPIVAKGLVVNNSTGAVAVPQPQTVNLLATAGDGYLWEPALYIAPNSAETNVDSGQYPDFVKGQYNNGHPVQGATPDPLPPGTKRGQEPDYEAEYIWNVANLGLTTGTYQAEFVIHDGDDNRGIGCVNITIQ